MEAINIHEIEKQKILNGLKLVHAKLIEFKKAKNSVLVIWKDGKVVKVKPN